MLCHTFYKTLMSLSTVFIKGHVGLLQRFKVAVLHFALKCQQLDFQFTLKCKSDKSPKVKSSRRLIYVEIFDKLLYTTINLSSTYLLSEKDHYSCQTSLWHSQLMLLSIELKLQVMFCKQPR